MSWYDPANQRGLTEGQGTELLDVTGNLAGEIEEAVQIFDDTAKVERDRARRMRAELMKILDTAAAPFLTD